MRYAPERPCFGQNRSKFYSYLLVPADDNMACLVVRNGLE